MNSGPRGQGGVRERNQKRVRRGGARGVRGLGPGTRGRGSRHAAARGGKTGPHGAWVGVLRPSWLLADLRAVGGG